MRNVGSSENLALTSGIGTFSMEKRNHITYDVINNFFVALTSLSDGKYSLCLPLSLRCFSCHVSSQWMTIVSSMSRSTGPFEDENIDNSWICKLMDIYKFTGCGSLHDFPFLPIRLPTLAFHKYDLAFILCQYNKKLLLTVIAALCSP